MAHKAERKRELAMMDLPSDAETIARALAFEQRSGLTRAEFSQAIGYGATTLTVYIGGNYSKTLTENHDGAHNTAAIRLALKTFMDKWEGVAVLAVERPAHRTADFERVFEACLDALDHASAYVVDGPPGTQKTFTLRAVEREINRTPERGRAIYVYARDDHKPLSFLREICACARVSGRGDTNQVLRKLRFFLGQQEERVLLLVDEAQHLPLKTLEVLRELLDLPPHFGIVLGGSHDIADKMKHLRMEQWRERARDTLTLQGPSKEECREIVRAELKSVMPGTLDNKACDAIIEDCWTVAQRKQSKSTYRQYRYISARLLFFAIADIQQQASAGLPSAARKESIA